MRRIAILSLLFSLFLFGCLDRVGFSGLSNSCEAHAKALIPENLTLIAPTSNRPGWHSLGDYDELCIVEGCFRTGDLNHWTDGSSMIPDVLAVPGTEAGQNVNLYYGRSLLYSMGQYSPKYSKQVVSRAGTILGSRNFAVAEFILEPIEGTSRVFTYGGGRPGWEGHGEFAVFKVIDTNIVQCNWVEAA